MNLMTVFAILALGASILLLERPSRVLAIIAACVSGLEVAIAFDVVTFGINGISVPLILGSVLTFLGVTMFVRTESKIPVAAATVLATVGLIQTLTALRLVSI